MTDVADLIKRDLVGAAVKREANRRAFPDTAEAVDRLSEIFGPVKVLHAIENGKEIGKPQPFDGIDANKIIAADDWSKAVQKRGKRA